MNSTENAAQKNTSNLMMHSKTWYVAYILLIVLSAPRDLYTFHPKSRWIFQLRPIYAASATEITIGIMVVRAVTGMFDIPLLPLDGRRDRLISSIWMMAYAKNTALNTLRKKRENKDQ